MDCDKTKALVGITQERASVSSVIALFAESLSLYRTTTRSMCSKCRMHILLIYLLVCLYYDCARHIPLSVSLNQVSGSVAPKNLDYLGPKFLYISFISAASNAKTDHSLETCTAEQQCQVRNDALQYVQNSTLSAYTGEKVLHCQSRPSSGVTRRAGGPPRVTPSRG